jgi:hypothetical protein
MIGALDWAKRHLMVHTSRTKRSTDFITLLETIDIYGPKPGVQTERPVVLVLDNGPIHTSKATRKALAARAHWLRIEWLPKYAPELNDIEVVWRGRAEAKAKELASRNPTRVSLLARLQKLIDSYNAGSLDVERLFEELMAFVRDLNEEEKRHVREALSEEELAIFDILTKPEPKLTKAQEVQVKKIARQLLDKLKREKLILDWRMKETAKAAVRQTIREELDELPEVYDRRLWEEKVERTYQFVYEHFGVTAAAATSQ